MAFLRSIKLAGLLSFPPGAPAIDLTPLNVLIGPNASGKSNLIEAIGVLRAAPTALAPLIRAGGTAAEWLWKGEPSAKQASLEVVVQQQQTIPELRYRLHFAPSVQRMEVIEEGIEETTKGAPGDEDDIFFYRFRHGQAVLSVRQTATTTTPPPPPPSAATIVAAPPVGHQQRERAFRVIARESLAADESVLSQFKDPDTYPELFWLGNQLSGIQIFQNWTFGSHAPMRRPEKTDLRTDVLLGDSENLGLVLNELRHSKVYGEYDRLVSRFLPRYERFSTRIQGNTVQFYLHEEGLSTPIPAIRLSDGTIRFLAILALLLSPTPPPLVCIEEPELGLHPDAVVLLADLLVDASNRTQLIVTTHSDALVSALSEVANSVVVCEHRGGTVLQRVDPDSLTDWLEKYRLGEVWRIGELGGNP